MLTSFFLPGAVPFFLIKMLKGNKTLKKVRDEIGRISTDTQVLRLQLGRFHVILIIPINV